jgi:hypothetical protein
MRRQHREATAAGIVLGTTRRRRKSTVEAYVDNTAKLRPQASVLAPRPCTCNAQRAAPRATGLYTTIKYMRGAAGIGLGTTIKHLRRTTSGTGGNGLSATMKYLRRTTSAAANNELSTTITPLVVRRLLK